MLRIEASRTVQRLVSKDYLQRSATKPTWPSPRGAPWTRTDVRGPKHPGLVGAGWQNPLCRGRLLLLCVCVGGAGCWEGRAHVGKRGIAWRGARCEGGGCSTPAGGHRVWEGGPVA